MAETPECQDSYPDFDGRFLKDLAPSIKGYTYHGESQLLDILESESARLQSSTDTSEFVLFHISKETIEELFDPKNEDTSITRFCTSFNTNEQLLLASMPSRPHSAVGPKIDIMIHEVLKPMSLSTALHSFHTATVAGRNRGKQPDTG